MSTATTSIRAGMFTNRWRFLIAASLLITHHSLLITASAQTMYGDVSYTKQTLFRIPFTTEPNERLKLVQLYYSVDQGQSWHPYDGVPPQQRYFDFRASKDGLYWFTTRTVDQDGRGNPLTMENARPGLKVCVDTQPPAINLRALTPRDGEVGVSWDVRDDNLDLSTLSLDYRLPGSTEWLVLSGETLASGQRYWRPNVQGTIEVRLRARDRASNSAEEKTQVSLSGPLPPSPSPIGGGGEGRGGAQPIDDRSSIATQPLASRHLVNSKRISLNYELKEVGPSRVSLVELWLTRDGRNWQKYREDTNAQPPFIVEVNDEGLYGFTLVARSGVGLGERPPQVGDPPQVWVEVDLTKPAVRILNIDPPRAIDDRNLTITWSASDKNFDRKPITLSYAEQADGPWTTIVKDFENTGRYVWAMPQDVPFRMYFKVEAADRAGNIGTAQTSNPILVDLSKPKVSIINVEPRSP
jgi:hypothetical protein